MREMRELWEKGIDEHFFNSSPLNIPSQNDLLIEYEKKMMIILQHILEVRCRQREMWANFFLIVFHRRWIERVKLHRELSFSTFLKGVFCKRFRNCFCSQNGLEIIDSRRTGKQCIAIPYVWFRFNVFWIAQPTFPMISDVQVKIPMNFNREVMTCRAMPNLQPHMHMHDSQRGYLLRTSTHD